VQFAFFLSQLEHPLHGAWSKGQITVFQMQFEKIVFSELIILELHFSCLFRNLRLHLQHTQIDAILGASSIRLHLHLIIAYHCQ